MSFQLVSGFLDNRRDNMGQPSLGPPVTTATPTATPTSSLASAAESPLIATHRPEATVAPTAIPTRSSIPTVTPTPIPTAAPTATPTTAPVPTPTPVPLGRVAFAGALQGEVSSPPFSLSSPPWKLVYTTSWSGYFSLQVRGESGGATSVVGRSVTSGVTYETYIYSMGELSGRLYFQGNSVPADGVWTVEVIENP